MIRKTLDEDAAGMLVLLYGLDGLPAIDCHEVQRRYGFHDLAFIIFLGSTQLIVAEMLAAYDRGLTYRKKTT